MQSAASVSTQGLADTLKDPDFLADAKKSKLDIASVAGEEMEKVIQGLYQIEPSMLARLKDVLVPK